MPLIGLSSSSEARRGIPLDLDSRTAIPTLIPLSSFVLGASDFAFLPLGLSSSRKCRRCTSPPPFPLHWRISTTHTHTINGVTLLVCTRSGVIFTRRRNILYVVRSFVRSQNDEAKDREGVKKRQGNKDNNCTHNKGPPLYL